MEVKKDMFYLYKLASLSRSSHIVSSTDDHCQYNMQYNKTSLEHLSNVHTRHSSIDVCAMSNRDKFVSFFCTTSNVYATATNSNDFFFFR